MNTSNSILDNMPLFIERARGLQCTVVAVLDNVILCHRNDNTFITWRARVYIDTEKNGEIFAEFVSGCYDMNFEAAKSNLLDRAWDITL